MREPLLLDARRALLERDPARAEEILADVEHWAPAATADALEETEHASSTRLAELELFEDAVRACFPDRAETILLHHPFH